MDSAPPPPKRRQAATVLAVLLLVAVVVGFAAYAILRAPRPPEVPPTVTLTVLVLGDPGDPRVVRVTEAAPELPLSSFRVTLRELYTSADVFDATLRPGTVYAEGNATFSCDDLTVSGRLSVGDEFHLADFPQGSYGLTLVHVESQRSLASVTVWF